MSDKPPSKKPKVARGKSDGKYLRAHGPTIKFQAQWLKCFLFEGAETPSFRGVSHLLCPSGLDTETYGFQDTTNDYTLGHVA